MASAVDVLAGQVRGGTLRQLEELVRQSSMLREAQETALSASDRLDDLKKELVRVKKEHSKMRTQLEKRRLAAVADTVGAHGDDAAGTVPEEVLSAVRAGSEDMVRKRKRREVAEVHRLAGKSLFALEDGGVALRFDTFHGGRYHETYYVVLAWDAAKRKLVVPNHTIPFHIPLAALCKRYLASDVAALMDALSTQLHAFVWRRETVGAVKRANPGVDVRANAAFDLIALDVAHDARTRTAVQLLYGDAASTLPTRVSVVTTTRPEGATRAAEAAAVQSRAQERQDRKWKATFESERLGDAFDTCFP